MAVIDSKTTVNGDALLISLEEPYKNVREIVSYSDVTEGETTDCFFNKFFRWGTDGVGYSDWVELNDTNLQNLMLNPEEPFWIEYKYEQVGDCTLTFVSNSLEVLTADGVLVQVPQLNCCSADSKSGALNLVVDCCESSWNPYDLSRASQMYDQLSSVASEIFGFCVKYFKTEADQRSKDVILKEYTLFNVINSDEINIMFPDNELPTREIQFNPLMNDWPVEFEVHIVKSQFRKVFGQNSRPEVEDYLYLKQYVNKMYQVNAVAEADDFLYSGSYWRVSLIPYQQKTSVGFIDKNIEDERNELVTSVEEEFAEEAAKEFTDVRKPNEYNTIGNLANDYVRRILDKDLIIKEENIYNGWTIFSKYHYQLSSLVKGTECVEYRYNDGWSSTDTRSFTGWFRPTYLNPQGNNVLIISIVNENGKVQINTNGLPTEIGQKISAGDWIKIRGTQSYNTIHKINSINGNSLILDTDYIDSVLINSPIFYKEANNTFISYEDDTQNFFTLTHTLSYFIIEINGTYYKYQIQNNSFLKDNWYSFVININNQAKQLSLFIYETVDGGTGSINPNVNTEFTSIFSNTQTVETISVPDENSWRLLACDLDLTNIRIWEKQIEEEVHNLILSQYVVKDSHLALLIDNASPRLLVNRITNPR